MNLKVLGLLGALAFAAPVAAVAAPANGLTAHSYSDLTTSSASSTGAAVAPGDTAKVEKIWWRRGWGCCGRFGYRYGWGWGRPYWGGRYYAWHRPWRHRYWVY